ncbi:MAG: hypothetical protein K0S68_367 [Candidatus Saccharibacteria bacterium]|jgi:hypothetical protein|nr:hypothetical protein [Candidatus Saccharibacteria bacterium]
MFIEADVYVSPDGLPVMDHPTDDAARDITRTGTPVEVHKAGGSDLSFEEFISRVVESNKGIKIDFKAASIVEPVLKRVAELRPEQPVIFNADVLQAEQASKPHIGPEFIELCRQYYPQGTLSIAWKTNPEVPYSEHDIKAMRVLLQDLDNVILCVRACLAQEAWDQMEQLIDGRDDRCLLLWNNEIVEPELKEWIENNTDPRRTLYDLIGQEKQRLALNLPEPATTK